MITGLPREVTCLIFDYLTPKELSTTSLVCKMFLGIAQEDAIWRSFCWQEFHVRVESDGKQAFKNLLSARFFRKILNGYAEVGRAGKKDVIDDFIANFPKTGIRRYQFVTKNVTLLKLKKPTCSNPFKFWVLAIHSPREWSHMPDHLEKKCFAELVALTLFGSRLAYGPKNRIAIYDKLSYVPKKDIFHHIRSFFDPDFNEELENPVEILKGFKISNDPV